MAEKMVEVKGGGQAFSAETVRAKFATYRHEIQGYLNSLEAHVDAYKFTVEKEGDALVIDVSVRATVHPKNKAGISK
jgi:ribosome-interacting GTPase 1